MKIEEILKILDGQFSETLIKDMIKYFYNHTKGDILEPFDSESWRPSDFNNEQIEKAGIINEAILNTTDFLIKEALKMKKTVGKCSKVMPFEESLNLDIIQGIKNNMRALNNGLRVKEDKAIQDKIKKCATDMVESYKEGKTPVNEGIKDWYSPAYKFDPIYIHQTVNADIYVRMYPNEFLVVFKEQIKISTNEKIKKKNEAVTNTDVYFQNAVDTKQNSVKETKKSSINHGGNQIE